MTVHVPRADFRLSSSFLDRYRGTQPDFGPLGALVYKRTYALELPDGSTEEFWQTCQRVIEGTFQILHGHCQRYHLPWSDQKAQELAQEAYERMFAFKWLPAGRGLSKMGTQALWDKGGACLNSCGFVSTKDLGNRDVPNAFSAPFTWLMDMSMLGVGVGFDTKGAGTVRIQRPNGLARHEVQDSREGWGEYLTQLLQCYVDPSVPFPVADYRKVRPYGAKIHGFGGTASGPEALERLTLRITTLLDEYLDRWIDSRVIVDLANSVGECVVAGGTRRSSEIAFGEVDDSVFAALKDYEHNPEAASWPRWASNNSMFVGEHTKNFAQLAEQTARTGEPGYMFLDNARAYGRMIDAPTWVDSHAEGGNPCVSAGTFVLTREGQRPIETMVGQVVDVWNGREWSAVEPRVTGCDQPILRVTLSDGSYLDCTDYHVWVLTDRHLLAVERRVRAADLQVGDLLAGYAVPLMGFPGEFITESRTVAAIERRPVADVVYCFNEPLNHTGCFNGIVTGQCLEQTLWNYELCNLCETFPSKCDDYADYERTLKFAYLYAKTVTLIPTHCAKTNAVMMRNRRIGCSQSGIWDNIARVGMREHLRWCDQGYKYICALDDEYSNWLGIPKSIKKTSTKPSGSISKVVGCREGIHQAKGEYEIQSVRLHDTSPLIQPLIDAGVKVEPAIKEPNTVVAYFPMHYPGQRERPASMWEQLELAAQMQAYWADNQVSVTIDFDPVTEGPQIALALELYAPRLKGVSFLPRGDDTQYEQMPKRVCTREEYETYKAQIKPIQFVGQTREVEERFCDGGLCAVEPRG